MGYISFMERKAQQEMLKRAVDAHFMAGTCVGMVFGPLWSMLEMGNPNREQVDFAINGWLGAWQDVRHLSDRNLHRNRSHYAIRPNAYLSPILKEFEDELRKNLADRQSDAVSRVIRVKQAYLDLMGKLSEFYEWAKNDAGPILGVDLARYEDKAARRAQNYWQPAVRQFLKGMDD